MLLDIIEFHIQEYLLLIHIDNSLMIYLLKDILETTLTEIDIKQEDYIDFYHHLFLPFLLITQLFHHDKLNKQIITFFLTSIKEYLLTEGQM